MLKYILFDIDNTLLSFDAYVRAAMESGLQKFGLRPFEAPMYDVFLRHNSRLWGAIERGELTLDELEQVRWNDIFRELDIDFDGTVFETYFKQELFHSAIAIDGALDLLRALHGKYVLCVASNGPYAQQVNRLSIAGMLPFFDALFISEEIGFCKPAAAFFDICLTRLHADPQQVMIIGDSPSSDILGGTRAGLRTCYYAPDGRPLPADINADYTVRSLREIVGIL